MVNPRVVQFSTSSDDEEGPSHHLRRRFRSNHNIQDTKRKKVMLKEEDNDEMEWNKENTKLDEDEDEDEQEEDPEEDEVEEDPEEEEIPAYAMPEGEVVRVSGKGSQMRKHYESFEFDNRRYDLEDPVLLVPEDENKNPYVAIIKDISQTLEGKIIVTGQWFYRPEEAEQKDGGSWPLHDTRELFYSFHLDEVPAESVMHKCVVHFVPSNKQLPDRQQHPGFIVHRVYDTEERRLYKLTDKDYEDNKQHEIDLLVRKTLSRLGDLPDIETNDAAAVVGQEKQVKEKRTLIKNISPLDVTRNEGTTRSVPNQKAETPGSCTSNTTEYYRFLSKAKVLTGQTHRDRWMVKLLQGVQYMCNCPDGLERKTDSKSSGTVNGSQEKGSKSGKSFLWPDAAVSAVTALEKATYDALPPDLHKYNLKYNMKLRQLEYNLKKYPLLARRLLNGELEPSTILNMSPDELKMSGKERNDRRKDKLVELPKNKKKSKYTLDQYQYVQKSMTINEARALQRASRVEDSSLSESLVVEESTSTDSSGDEEARVAIPDASRCAVPAGVVLSGTVPSGAILGANLSGAVSGAVPSALPRANSSGAVSSDSTSSSRRCDARVISPSGSAIGMKKVYFVGETLLDGKSLSGFFRPQMRNHLDGFYPRWCDVPIDTKNVIWESFKKEWTLDGHDPSYVYSKFLQQCGVQYRKFISELKCKQMMLHGCKDVMELMNKPKPAFMKSDEAWQQYVQHWNDPEQRARSTINARNRNLREGCSHGFGRKSAVTRLHEMAEQGKKPSMLSVMMV